MSECWFQVRIGYPLAERVVSPGYTEEDIISRILTLLTLAYIASSLSWTPATPRCPRPTLSSLLRVDKATYGRL